MTRLETIYSLIPPCRLFMDIGTDHGYIARHAATKAERVIACDISERCIDKAKKRVKAPNIDFRLGDGVHVLEPNEKPDIIAICGMGGLTAIEILQDYMGDAGLILQLQSDAPFMRSFLTVHGYTIDRDFLVEEKRRFYDIITCTRNPLTDKAMLDELAINFGKFYKEKNPQLKNKLTKMYTVVSAFRPTPENESRLKLIKEALDWQK